MIRKLKAGGYRLYSRKKDESGKRRNLGTFKTREEAERPLTVIYKEKRS